MSEARFGNRYFATRERLAQLDCALKDLAAGMGVDLPVPDDLAAAHRCLDSPFVFLAVGEVNSGKSSLLNALAGAEICPTSPLPETKSVTIHLHAALAEAGTLPDLCCEVPGEQPFLRHFTLIDTPGLDSRMDSLQAAIQSQIPRTDLIFCVFSVANPWAAPTWNWLHTLPGDALDRTVIVVQRCDERDPKDLPVILGHLADLALKRLGRTLPMFTVSARQTLAAPGSTTEKHRPGGFGPLEEYIAGNVCLSPVRWQALRTLREYAASQLALLDDRIDLQHRHLIHHHRFVDSVEREIDRMRQGFVDRLPLHLHDVAEAFQHQAIAVAEELHSRLGAIRSFCQLLRGTSAGQDIELSFSKRLRAAVTEAAQTDAAEVTSACLDHWAGLAPRIRLELGVDPTLDRPVAELLAAATRDFMSRLDAAAQNGIGHLRVRLPLENDLRDRNLSLKSFFATSLLMLSAAGCTGALGFRAANTILLGLALLFWWGGVAVAWTTRRNVTRDFQNRLLDTCGHFALLLQQDYLDALQAVFRDYASTLEQVRDHLTRERQAVGPKQQRWQQLFLVLKTIEQDG